MPGCPLRDRKLVRPGLFQYCRYSLSTDPHNLVNTSPEAVDGNTLARLNKITPDKFAMLYNRSYNINSSSRTQAYSPLIVIINTTYMAIGK